MHRFHCVAIVLLFLRDPSAIAAEPLAETRPPHPGRILRRHTLASFSGSGQTAIRALAADSIGNVYVTGTTSAPDFPVRNAAQPASGLAGIMRTADLGATWTRVGSPPQDITALAPDPIAPEVLFAWGPAGIYKTVDAGRNWRLVYPFSYTRSFTGYLVIDPGNHMRLAALRPDGALIRSLDGGETWSVTSVDVVQLYADPTGSGALIVNDTFHPMISRDWGGSFQPFVSPAPSLMTRYVAFDPLHPGSIYVGTSGGSSGLLWLSTGFGAAWTVKTNPGGFYAGHLMVEPAQPGTIFAATGDGVFLSTDGATSWKHLGTASLGDVAPFALPGPGCAPAGAVFDLAGVVWFSPDYGKTWGLPQLTSVTSLVNGLGCTTYATRRISSGVNAFVAKLAPDGTLIWATYLGGCCQDTPAALAVDGAGNVYVTGNTQSPDFPSTLPRIGVRGQSAVFATSYSTDAALAYSVLIGGEATNSAAAIAVDAGHNAYIAGSTASAGFPVTPGALAPSPVGSGFLAKVSFNGTLAYATYLAGYPTAVLVEAAGPTIVAGVGPGPGLPPPQGTDPEYLVKLDRTGSRLIASTYLPGTQAYGTAPPYHRSIGPSALAEDKDGNVLVFGGAPGPDFTAAGGGYVAPQPPTACAFQDGSAGSVYVMKLAAADWKPVYSAVLGATCGIIPGSMAVDATGAVVLGMSTAAGVPLQDPLVTGSRCSDPYGSSAAAKLSSDGSSLVFATYLGALVSG